MPTLRMSAFGGKADIPDPLADGRSVRRVHARRHASCDRCCLRRHRAPVQFSGNLEKVTINITEEKLTEDQLEQYRQGRVRSAIAQ